MQSIDILRQCSVNKTARLLQMSSIFDLSIQDKSIESWKVNFELPESWNIGLIVGPSGGGKTTVAKEIFGDYILDDFAWSDDKSIVDDFPKEMSINDICDLLSSVGFSSPPLWVRPFYVLSNGEKFRVNMARTIAEMKDIAVVDEFTSVVDRTVAQIGSAAIAKTIRKRDKKFIAVSCHYDIIDWLEPDWVYQPHLNQFYSGRYLHQRPKINLEIRRVHLSAWEIFRKYHYLDTKLNTSAICFCAFWDQLPVAFTAVLHFPHKKTNFIKREHRTVCLPDYQGVGIGNAMSDFVASLFCALGYRYLSQTSHPAMIRSRAKSNNWKMIAKPNMMSRTMGSDFTGRDESTKTKGIATRLRATFEYIGPCMTSDKAKAMLLEV